MHQTIEITVHYFAKLRDLTNKEKESIEIAMESTPKDIYKQLNEMYGLPDNPPVSYTHLTLPTNREV